MKGAHSYPSRWVCHLSGPTRLIKAGNPAQQATSRVHLCTFQTLGMTFSKEIPMQPEAEALIVLKRGQAFSYPHQVPGAKNC